MAIQAALVEKELMQRIIDRSSKIATTATESLVKKDFALDSDDTIMLTSAHNLARYECFFLAILSCSTFFFLTFLF